jgi:recombination protein RecR
MLLKSLEKFKRNFSRLPGIGEKTAEKLGFYILTEKKDFAKTLADSIIELKENSRVCAECGNISDTDPCVFCGDLSRDNGMVCVVESALDVYYIEETDSFNGLYHILGGLISPLNGVMPDDLRLSSLLDRIVKRNISEVIIGTSPTTEGDTTALYIRSMIDEKFGAHKIKVTHLARGIPIGTDIQFAGKGSLSQALKNREQVG